MIDYSRNYRSGETIQHGDYISLAGKAGQVLFVLGHRPYPPEFRDEVEFLEKQFKKGFMVTTEAWGKIFMEDSDEDLLLMSRK